MVLCHAKATRVDEANDTLVVDLDPLDVRSSDPAEQFRQVLWSLRAIYPIYGVIREALRRTQLFRSHSGSDRILLAELSLLGQLYQIPELLLYERETLSSRSNQRPSFFDTSNKDRPPFKHWRLCSATWPWCPLQAADAGAKGRPGPQHPGPLRDPRRPPHAGRRQTGQSHRAGRGLAFDRPLAAPALPGFQVGPVQPRSGQGADPLDEGLGPARVDP